MTSHAENFRTNQLKGTARAIIADYQDHLESAHPSRGYQGTHAIIRVTERNAEGNAPESVAAEIYEMLAGYIRSNWMNQARAAAMDHHKGHPAPAQPCQKMEDALLKWEQRQGSGNWLIRVEKKILENYSAQLRDMLIRDFR